MPCPALGSHWAAGVAAVAPHPLVPTSLSEPSAFCKQLPARPAKQTPTWHNPVSLLRLPAAAALGGGRGRNPGRAGVKTPSRPLVEARGQHTAVCGTGTVPWVPWRCAPCRLAVLSIPPLGAGEAHPEPGSIRPGDAPRAGMPGEAGTPRVYLCCVPFSSSELSPRRQRMG